MLLQSIPELEIIGVYDRGKANAERIVLKAQSTIDMVRYALLVGTVAVDGAMRYIYPARDAFFYFGPGTIQAGQWLIVYTGSGEALTTTMQGTGETVYVVHWGRQNTMFANSSIAPALVRLDTIEIVPPPSNVPQSQPRLIQ